MSLEVLDTPVGYTRVSSHLLGQDMCDIDHEEGEIGSIMYWR